MSLRNYFEQRARENSWAPLYEGPPDLGNYNFLTRRTAVADLLVSDGAFPRVLDVGCGTGDYAEIAARHDGVYHGVDFAPAMVRTAVERTGRDGAATAGRAAHFAVGSGEHLPFPDETFDLVLALGYVAYFHDPRPPIAEVRRVLKPGGTLIMQVCKPDLIGWLDRAVLRPLGALARGRRPPQPELPDGWVNIKYTGAALDGLLGEAGFRRTARAFNHFQVLPAFLRRRFPGPSIRLSEKLTGCCANAARAFAVNYIGKYELRR